jgi:hypothetical protein
VFFRGIIWIQLELHDEMLLLHLDALNDQTGECIIGSPALFILEPQFQKIEQRCLFARYCRRCQSFLR